MLHYMLRADIIDIRLLLELIPNDATGARFASLPVANQHISFLSIPPHAHHR